MLPGLFHIGMWKGSHDTDGLKALAFYLIAIALRFCLRTEDDLSLCDAEIGERRVAVAILSSMLIGRNSNGITGSCWRISLLNSDPTLFVVASILEMLGWWCYQGFDLVMSLHDTPLTTERIGNVVEWIKERKGWERLSYLFPVAESMIDGRNPTFLVSKDVLLFWPFANYERCGFDGCRKHHRTNGSKLLRCKGECGGMEYYCCKKHQVLDWECHQHFCKSE